MTCTFSLSRFCLLRRLCSLVCALVGCCSLPSGKAQNLDKPLINIDEDITAFAYAADARIAYSVHRNFKTKEYDLEHDDVWLQDATGKRPPLLQAQKFNPANRPSTSTSLPLPCPPNPTPPPSHLGSPTTPPSSPCPKTGSLASFFP